MTAQAALIHIGAADVPQLGKKPKGMLISPRGWRKRAFDSAPDSTGSNPPMTSASAPRRPLRMAAARRHGLAGPAEAADEIWRRLRRRAARPVRRSAESLSGGRIPCRVVAVEAASI